MPDKTVYEKGSQPDFTGCMIKVFGVDRYTGWYEEQPFPIYQYHEGVTVDSSAFRSDVPGTYKIYVNYTKDGVTAQTSFDVTVKEPERRYPLGDVNMDGTVDASDASIVLMEYAAVSNSQPSTLTDIQKQLADVSGDRNIDASDASLILSYYSYSVNGEGDADMEHWLAEYI